MSRPRWPKEVPILDASDSFLEDCDGRTIRINTLGYWLSRTFEFRSEAYQQAYVALRSYCDDGWRGKNGGPRHTPLEDADTWNRAMADLGYVEGNPAATRSNP